MNINFQKVKITFDTTFPFLDKKKKVKPYQYNIPVNIVLIIIPFFPIFNICFIIKLFTLQLYIIVMLQNKDSVIDSDAKVKNAQSLVKGKKCVKSG